MGILDKLIKAQSGNFGGGSGFFGTGMSGMRRTASKVSVTHEKSQALAAYYAAIRNISEDIGKLPIKVFQYMQDGSKAYLADNNVNRLFNLRPNSDMSAMTFKEVMTSHALGWGNGYAEIIRNQRGEVVELYPIHPSRVEVKRNEKTGDIEYLISEEQSGGMFGSMNNKGKVILAPADVLHLKGLGGDGLVGHSVLQFQAECLGTAIATQEYGGSFFGNGTSLSGILTHPEALSEEARKNLRDSWQNAHAGSENAFKVAVLEEGVTWKETSVPPAQAQYIEFRKFLVEDIARWFRIAPSKIGDLTKMTYNNYEQVSIDYATDTLSPWVTRWEQEIDIKLLNADEDSIVGKFMLQTLTRGDMKTRTEHYAKMMQIGVYSVNEVREFEDMNPIGEEGDQRYMQTSMTTLDQIGASQTQASGLTSDESQQPGSTSALALEPVLFNALEIIETKEAKAVDRQLSKGEGFEDFEDLCSKWAEDFYRTQLAYAFKMVDPIIASFSRTANLSRAAQDELKSNCYDFLSEVYNSAWAKVSNLERPEHTAAMMGETILNMMNEATT